MENRYMIMFEEFGGFLQVVDWRRELHRYPELSFSEYRTQKFIASVLAENGIRFREIVNTGILAEIVGENKEGKGGTVVLRADIDALPMEEKSGCEFSSQTVGIMHACGHDMHTAMLLGVLQMLNNHRADFSGRVLGLFQPAEECNPGGASIVLADGVFDKYDDILAFIGAHIDPIMPSGTFGFRAGQYMASSDELRICVRGIGGHAALRDQIKDPVKAAAYLSTALYDLPAKVDCSGKGRVMTSLGQVEATGSTNIVPSEIYLAGTMRTFEEECRVRLKQEIVDVARRIDEEHGTKTEVTFGQGYPSIYNDPKITEYIIAKTTELFGADNVRELDLRLTSDDFGYYTQLYPSLYYRVGVGGRGSFFEEKQAGNVHTPKFNPDEKAMSYGCIEMGLIAIELLNNGYGE